MKECRQGQPERERTCACLAAGCPSAGSCGRALCRRPLPVPPCFSLTWLCMGQCSSPCRKQPACCSLCGRCPCWLATGGRPGCCRATGHSVRNTALRASTRKLQMRQRHAPAQAQVLAQQRLAAQPLEGEVALRAGSTACTAQAPPAGPPPARLWLHRSRSPCTAPSHHVARQAPSHHVARQAAF